MAQRLPTASLPAGEPTLCPQFEFLAALLQCLPAQLVSHVIVPIVLASFQSELTWLPADALGLATLAAKVVWSRQLIGSAAAVPVARLSVTPVVLVVWSRQSIGLAAAVPVARLSVTP